MARPAPTKPGKPGRSGNGPVNDPNGPQTPRPPANESGYSPIKYGEKGLKTGIAKAGQARNQPGFVPLGQRDGVPNVPEVPTDALGDPLPQTDPLSYLSPEQQARVTKLLGDQYDPAKPLNIQMFKARWSEATPEERRQIAKELSGQFLEGGPQSKSLTGFHGEYLDILREENVARQQNIARLEYDYTHTLGGYASTQIEADADIAHWTEFANTPEGAAHIAQTGMSTDEWLKSVTEGVQAGADNYAVQQQHYAQIAKQYVLAGKTPPGMKPPGWDSTLEAIRQGQGPLPGAAMLAKYPGIAADLAGISPDLYAGPQGSRRDGSTGAQGTTNTAYGEPATMPVYQGAPAFTQDEINADYI